MSWRAKLWAIGGLVRGLKESDVDPDPIVQFRKWYAFARRAGCPWPDSMALATVGANGRPAVRLMLLKGVDERGFVFYTHYNRRKAGEMAAHPHVALSFHWVDLIRQVRVEGRVEKATPEESEAYFHSRLRGSQIGAWASPQSETLAGRDQLERAVQEYTRQFKGREVPLPPHWGGYRVVPDRIEFWQGRPSRLHDRLCFTRTDSGWRMVRLAP